MARVVPVSNIVRNPEGVWINSNAFREEGLFFMKNGYFCNEPEDSPAYLDYWDEHLDRCINGYTSGGAKITQHHYFYLNFTQININEATGGKTGSKKMAMPDFWDGDYGFFWGIEIAKNGLFTDFALAPSTLTERAAYNELEKERVKILLSMGETTDNRLRENSDKRLVLEEKVLDRLKLPYTIEIDWRDGGHHVIVGKARRKGYSFKNGAICANIYNTIRNSLVIIGASDKKFLYPKGTMGMASDYLSFLNKHTAWGKGREYVDKQDHKRASYRLTGSSGVQSEAGYMSDIMALTFADNPDAARGKDAKLVLFEEAGAFPNLKASFDATAPGLAAGKYITGQIIIFGTGGDMESGTADFADIFYHPKQRNIMPFVNIWDENAENSSCGFFHPVTMNMEGHYDKQGNSDIAGATLEEKLKRKQIISDSSDSGVMQQHVQEWPFNPSEAFLTVSMNDFPVMELRNQYNRVVRENLHLKKGQPVFLGQDAETRKIVAIPDLEGELHPLWDYKPKTKDIKGCVVIYEYPMSNPPRGLYKIGFDPYRQAKSKSTTTPSLASITVYKGTHKYSSTNNTIVAEFVGRPYSTDEVNRTAGMLAELYNAEIMHENEVTEVVGYFTKKNKLHLLAAQPDGVISKNIKASTVARIYGIHMVDKLKDAGEKYIKKWLLTKRDIDENGDGVLQLETIYNPALLEELILYNRDGNFDRVMSLMMLMFQIEEEEEDKEYGTDVMNENATELLELMNNQFRNTNALY